jgi:signal transduction histidine kinase
VALLQTFADQAVIAIENVRLFTELQEKNRALTDAHAQITQALERQTATADILRIISRSQTDVQPVFDTIADSAIRLLHGWSALILLIDGGLLHLGAVRGGLPDSERYQRGRFPVRLDPDYVLARCVLERSPQQEPDILSHPNLTFREVARRRGFAAFLAVPMLRGGEAIGEVVVTRARAGPFNESEIALLQTFADQAVIAIANARLLSELQARTAQLTHSVGQLTALGDVGRALSSTLDLDTILQTIVTRASQLAGTDACSVFEYDEATEAFHLPATHNLDEEVVALARRTPIRKGEGVQGLMAITHQPVQVPDIAAEDTYRGPLRDVLLRTGTRALLAIPMLREEQLIGGFTVAKKTPGEFPQEVIELLKTFATQSALAIQNARLFREIADKSRQLEAASRHKSEFLANMSHELRTPLNAIIGFSEVLTERMFGELNEKQEEYLKDIYASGQHLLSLINDILDLSKIEAGRMELELTDFDLPTAIENALTLVRERAGRRGIALHHAVDYRLGQIRGDERKIKQVLLNLLSNALKFTPEGGRVEVRASVVDGRTEIAVTDTGVGIAPEDLEAVFEEFRQVGTADKKVEGTGLGLTLSRKFIELHGGRIWVKSQVGVGSTFTFTLPLTS